MNKIKMEPADARETYEMLRASHTLLRMAFGACAIVEQPSDKDAARRFTNKFEAIFNIIKGCAEKYLEYATSGVEDSNTASDNAVRPNN